MIKEVMKKVIVENNKNLHDDYVKAELYSDYEAMLFDYLNSDFTLLILHILLEDYANNYEGLWIFTLDEFIKGDYWEVKEISEEIRDTNDFSSIGDMVFNKVAGIIQNLELAGIKRVGINGISELPKLLIKKVFTNGSPTDDEIEYYASIIDEIYELKDEYNKKIKTEMEKSNSWEQGLNRVDFNTLCEASKHIIFICELAPSHIELEVIFNDEVAKEISKEIDNYLINFAQDRFIDKKPTYQEKKFYFSKQLENFYEYIKKLPMIDGFINLPFLSLQETGFEVVKILSYLEKEKKIKVRNWNDENLWNVKFYTTPLSLESITSSRPNSEQSTKKGKPSENPIKFEQSILYFKDKEIDFTNKRNQKDLLITLFKEPAKNWSYDEIQEDWDEEMAKNLIKYPENYWRKFYTAGDGINQAIAIKTQTEDFIIKDTKEIRINPKYI